MRMLSRALPLRSFNHPAFSVSLCLRGEIVRWRGHFHCSHVAGSTCRVVLSAPLLYRGLRRAKPLRKKTRNRCRGFSTVQALNCETTLWRRGTCAATNPLQKSFSCFLYSLPCLLGLDVSLLLAQPKGHPLQSPLRDTPAGAPSTRCRAACTHLLYAKIRGRQLAGPHVASQYPPSRSNSNSKLEHAKGV